MGVAAALPEVSEWTLPDFLKIFTVTLIILSVKSFQ